MSHLYLKSSRSYSAPLRRALAPRSRPLLSSPASQTSRLASTTASAASDARSLARRLKILLYGTSLSLAAVFGYLYMTDTRASIHQWATVPLIRYLFPDAEDAHHFGTTALRTLYGFGLNPRERTRKDSKTDIGVIVFGHKLQNPIGTSAGIDKLAEVPDALFALGPAIVEVGGCTPLAQEGNPKPRLFRLPGQNALINRYGLNSKGADDMAKRLRERVRLYAYNEGYGAGEDAEQLVLDGAAGVPPGSLIEGKLLAVQVAKNKDTNGEDIAAVTRDYVYCVERLARYADILVVNVSSPNTPGLRTLQRVEPLTQILEGVVGAAKEAKRKTSPKVMVKVSPDEDSDEQLEGIAEAIWRSGVDGVIVGNTTNRRTDLVSADSTILHKESQLLREQGGYSGPQMFPRTLSLVKRYRALLDQGPSLPPSTELTPKTPEVAAINDQPISSTINDKLSKTKETSSTAIGVKNGVVPVFQKQEKKVIFATGGITNGKQALEILNAGASVAQIYTALIYGGVGTVLRIKSELRNEVERK
ncbi:hypothetical protein BJ878DRAFT_529534 [Calycina marina]|uniref:Dihydroorotate dehydrogenase catalytic domain-containing protein n=1 Tax=Calycina marina TaxID=1763456 RepID=A0A9P8CAH5_9HELO|nr:hypothetical protein BJ878DRAFT_529534 [Calycina marina]